MMIITEQSTPKHTQAGAWGWLDIEVWFLCICVYSVIIISQIIIINQTLAECSPSEMTHRVCIISTQTVKVWVIICATSKTPQHMIAAPETVSTIQLHKDRTSAGTPHDEWWGHKEKCFDVEQFYPVILATQRQFQLTFPILSKTVLQTGRQILGYHCCFMLVVITKGVTIFTVNWISIKITAQNQRGNKHFIPTSWGYIQKVW